jgi:DNA-directed RNA polymerase specialized sigma24 family protein
MSACQHIETIMRAPAATLDTLARAVWQDFGAGRITEAEAGAMAEAIDARRKALNRPIQGQSPLKVVVVREETERPPVTNVEPRGAARSGPRQLALRIPRPAAYDRTRSRERRRVLAASGGLPARLAASFTCGEQAVLRVIADEVRDHGRCDRTLGEIAARAGVCRTTVQNAIREAVKRGLIAIQERRQPGARSLSNVIRIVSAEWRGWLARGSKGGGFKKLNPTDSLCFTRGLRDSDVRANVGRTQPPDDQGRNRAHRHSAL